MSDNSKMTKQKMLQLINYTYAEFVKPAWENWLELEGNRYTLAAFDLWSHLLFTDESRIQVTIKSSAVNFVERKLMYCLVLGYIDETKHVRVQKPFFWEYKYKPE